MTTSAALTIIPAPHERSEVADVLVVLRDNWRLRQSDDFPLAVSVPRASVRTGDVGPLIASTLVKDHGGWQGHWIVDAAQTVAP
ncbi:MAG: hypothetical protein ABWX92_15180 [Mycetocola sp.]